MSEGRKVTWFPSYGAEMRGGTANCTVVISDTMIGSPVVLNPDILIVMNSISMERFLPRIARNGHLFYDCSLIPDPPQKRHIIPVPVPATDIASTVATTRSANMVMLGAVVAETKILRAESLMKAFEKNGGSRDMNASDVNIMTIQEGIRYIENQKSSHTGR